MLENEFVALDEMPVLGPPQSESKKVVTTDIQPETEPDVPAESSQQQVCSFPYCPRVLEFVSL